MTTTDDDDDEPTLTDDGEPRYRKVRCSYPGCDRMTTFDPIYEGIFVTGTFGLTMSDAFGSESPSDASGHSRGRIQG
jgi:hypothetical protein